MGRRPKRQPDEVSFSDQLVDGCRGARMVALELANEQA